MPADRIGAIPGSHITANTITGTQILDGTIATTELADSAVATAKLAANAVVTSKIGDAQVTAAKLAVRTRTKEFYPNYPNSYLKVHDLGCSLDFDLSRQDGSVSRCGYRFQNNSSTTKSGFIGFRCYLPEDVISLTSLALNFVVTGDSKVLVKVYDSTGALVKSLNQLSVDDGLTSGVVTSTGAIQDWTTATNLVGSKWYAVEIECKGFSTGDTITIYDFKEVVSYQ